MIMVSACLVGIQCKYNGGCNTHQGVLTYLQGKDWIPVCPEQLGGLATPRTPAEIQGGSGEDVLQNRVKVMTKTGEDVTAPFRKGAEQTLKIAQMAGVKEAILKERSPSCGGCQIYDGSFLGQPKAGQGVTAALLREHGISIHTEDDFPNK